MSSQITWVLVTGQDANGEINYASLVRDFGVVGSKLYLDNAPNGEANQKDPLLEFVGFNYGIPEFESRFMPGVSGVTPGPFIIYSTSASEKKSLNTHEPGHVIQFILLRGYKRYLPLVAIPSLFTATFFPDHHHNMPWEKTANQLWFWLTGENHPSNPLYFDKRKKKR